MVGHLAFYGAGFFEMQGYVVTEGGPALPPCGTQWVPLGRRKTSAVPVQSHLLIVPQYLRCSVWF